VYNGTYKDVETAAHASDTLARKLVANGEKNQNLNFPDDNTEVHWKNYKVAATNFYSEYIGVSYNKIATVWQAYRRSKNKKKIVYNGTYKDENTAAHASDTLARELIEDGEHHILNFPDDDTEVHKKIINRNNKRQRPHDFDKTQTNGNVFKN